MDASHPWLHVFNRSVLQASPFLGALLIAGYLITGLHPGSLPNEARRIVLSELAPMTGEQITERIRAAHGAAKDIAARLPAAAMTPVAEPRTPALAGAPAYKPEGVRRSAGRQALKSVAPTLPQPVSLAAAPPQAAPEPQPEEASTSLLGRSWRRIASVGGAVADHVVDTPGTVWRTTRKTVGVVRDTSLEAVQYVVRLAP